MTGVHNPVGAEYPIMTSIQNSVGAEFGGSLSDPRHTVFEHGYVLTYWTADGKTCAPAAAASARISRLGQRSEVLAFALPAEAARLGQLRVFLAEVFEAGKFDTQQEIRSALGFTF